MPLSRVMASAEMKKVLELKLQLRESTEGHTLLKTLKKLQELNITLEILSETGIGKVVNSFRKHEDAGEVAKTLVHQWKKLVPHMSVAQHHPQSPKEASKTGIQQLDQKGQIWPSENAAWLDRKSKNETWSPAQKLPKNVDDRNKVKPIANKSKDCTNNDKKDGVKKDSDVGFLQSKEKSTGKLTGERKYEGKHKVSDVTNKLGSKISTKGKNGFSNKDKRDKKDVKTKAAEMEKDLESDDFETPSMSFEEYLSYDLEAPKRRKKLCESKNPKRIKVDLKQNVKMRDSSTNLGSIITEAPNTLFSKRCVMDLLNVPLPTVSPEDLSHYQYFTEKKVEEKAVEVCEEAPVFTGQRLNKKMQVYSGTKVMYLPTMMTLYQQCIRTLQNNIDSLYEIGGVPFEILEPVLERCMPEQLQRIEECNPVYVGVTDHLWERHCLRDFRNAQLEEYESWREMYLRLFEERERKFLQLTKSIVSAHSGKPKGRQVKMAFIHSAAKPPRNVRIQQELHVPAVPGLPPAVDKLGGRIPESRGRPGFTESPKPFNSGSGVSQAQDTRRIRRVAPMMAKSLKDFKKQIGRR